MIRYSNLTHIVRRILLTDEETRTDCNKLYAAVLSYYKDAEEKPQKSSVRKAKYRVVSVSPELSGAEEDSPATGMTRRSRSDSTAYKKPVRCIESDIVYDTIRHAAMQSGIQINAIYKCLSNEVKTAGGCHWEYVMEPETLCWSCVKSCGGRDCPWANRLQPVPGWDAKPTRRIYSGKIETAYTVTSCPLFEQE